MSNEESPLKPVEQDESIHRMSEYAQVVSIFLSTIDDLRKRKYDKDTALITSGTIMKMFLAYKAGIEYEEEPDEELEEETEIIFKPEDLA